MIGVIGDQAYVSKDEGATFDAVPDALPFLVPTSTVYAWWLIAYGGKLMLFAINTVCDTTDQSAWTPVELPWADRVNFGPAPDWLPWGRASPVRR